MKLYSLLSLIIALSLSSQAHAQESTLKFVIGEVSGLAIASTTKSELTEQLVQAFSRYGDVVVSKGAGHLVQTQVHGLGSTFSVTITLSNSAEPEAKKIIIRESGKRSANTFAEITDKALARLFKVAKLELKGSSSSITTLATTQHSESYTVAAPNVGKRKSWYQRWWVWTIVGGVAASATTAAILGLPGEDSATVKDPNSNNNNGGGSGTSLETTIELK